jgi:hypothetical protein
VSPQAYYAALFSPPQYPGRGLNESLGREAMGCTILKPKQISRQMECVDLTTTISE